MPTGPFAALGYWQVYEHTGETPKTGAAPRVEIIKATSKYIKYKRKNQKHDPQGKRIHHGKVFWDGNTFRVSVGGFQHIKQEAKDRHKGV